MQLLGRLVRWSGRWKRKHGKPSPDDIDEQALRLHLVARPHDLELTRALVALLHRLDRPPMPDLAAAGADRGAVPDGGIEALIRAADAHAQADDLFRLYAALWQACVRYPDDARGWSDYARRFAERYEWRNCRIAVARAFALPGAPTPASAAALLAALSLLAEHGQLQDLDWQAWFARVPEALRVDANAVRLLVAQADPRAAALVPRLVAARPASADALLAASMAAYEQEQWDDAYVFLRRALEAEPAATLHTVVRSWSGPAFRVLEATGKADELAAWMSERHAEHPAINLVPPRPAPEARLVVERQRRCALDRGLPAFLFIPQAKSASATVHNIIASGFELPTVLYALTLLRVIEPWARDYMQGGSSYATHLMPTRRNIDLLAAAGAKRLIVHVRDPRQVMISSIEHIRRYPREMPPSARRAVMDRRDGIEYAIEQRLPSAIAWIEGWRAARDRVELHFTTFDAFVADRSAFVDRLLALYGGDARYFDRAAVFHQSPATDFHRRRGETDEWRSLLDRAQTDRVNAKIPDAFWRELGWSP
jgi:hypothetical protein